MRRLLLRVLPRDWREALEGDLREESGGARSGWRAELWITLHIAVIAARFGAARVRERLASRFHLSPRTWAGDAVADLRYGLRRWAARPLFAAAAILTLALGVGVTAALFSLVDGVLLKPLPYPDADRLVVVNRTYPEWVKDPILAANWNRISLAWPEFFHVRETSRTLEDVAVQTTMTAVMGGGAAEEARVAVVSASFLPLLGVRPHLGALFNPEDDIRDPRSVIISHGLWVRRFGADPAILGRTLQLDSGARVVAGVLPARFDWGASWGWRGYDLWFPLSAIPERSRTDNNRNLDAIARLRSGVTPAEASDEAAALLREHFRFKTPTGGLVTPLVERQTHRVRQPLLLLLAGAILLLAIACANVAGLLVGDASSRTGEMAVRAALGAGRGRLVRQLFSEGVLLAAVGSAGGLLIALWGVRVLVALAPADLPRLNDVALDGRVVAFASGAGLLTALLFVFLPALGLGRGGAHHLRDAGRGGTARRRLSSALALTQVALGVVLLSGAGLFVRSVRALEHVDAGFDRTNLLTLRISLPSARYPDAAAIGRFLETSVAALEALPGVRDAAATSGLALVTGRASTSITVLDPTGSRKSVEAQRRYVSPEYFHTMGLRTLRGRTFSRTDGASAPRIAVVSEEMERRIFGGSAIGRRFIQSNQELVIAGVVNDVRDLALDSDPQPTFYVPTPQDSPWRIMRLVVRTGPQAATLVPAVRAALAAVDPGVPVEDVATMDTLVRRSIEDERYRAVLIVSFAVVAGVLAGIGLYSTLARRVLDRRREIGLRLALGARPEQVRGLFLREGLGLAAGGALIGVPAALLLARLLRSLLFGVTPADAVTLVAVVAATGAIALLATFVPAIRASRLDPLAVLRAE